MRATELMRRSTALAAVTALAALAAGCGGSDEDAASGGGGDKGAVAMSFGGLDIVLWNDIIEMMRPQVKAAGYELLVDDPQWKVDKQVQDWDAWITRGNVKAIMGFPIQVDALIPVTARATAAGIPVLGYTQNWKGTKAALVTKPIEDGKLLGDAAGKWVAERFGDKKVDVAVLTDRSSDLGRGRSDGMMAAVKAAAPNAVIHQVPSLTREEGFEGAKRQLIAHPDTRVWIGLGDDHVQGAYRAVLDSGVAKDDPDTFFGSLDLTNDSLDIMAIPDSIWRVGFVFTSTELAKANSQMLIDAAEGRPVEDYLIKATQVTPDNIEQFYVGDRKKTQ